MNILACAAIACGVAAVCMSAWSIWTLESRVNRERKQLARKKALFEALVVQAQQALALSAAEVREAQSALQAASAQSREAEVLLSQLDRATERLRSES